MISIGSVSDKRHCSYRCPFCYVENKNYQRYEKMTSDTIYHWLEEVYDKEKIKNDWFHHDFVKTPFERAIECDEDHAINYVVQSTTADIVYENSKKILDLCFWHRLIALSSCQSRIQPSSY